MVKANSCVTSVGHPVPLCGSAGAERFSLLGTAPAGTPFCRQADHCVADVRERPLTASSTRFLF